MYHIVGNFQGIKLLQIIYNFTDFIFMNFKKSQKEWKLLALKVSGYTVVFGRFFF